MKYTFKNINFGFPTLIECKDIKACISLCQELKLQFIEINMNLPQYQTEVLDIKTLKEAVKNGVYFTFHLDENLNVADFNDKISKAYIDTTLETIQIAKEIGAPILNMHMTEGVYFTLPDKKVYLFEEYEKDYQKKLIDFRKVCEKAIGDSNIKICIENCNGYFPFMQRGIDLLLESKVFGLTLDIGHSHVAKGIDEDFIQNRIDRLAHIHIHDAKGKSAHLTLGTGEINLQEKLLLAEKRNCSCVLETKTIKALKESLSYLS